MYRITYSLHRYKGKHRKYVIWTDTTPPRARKKKSNKLIVVASHLVSHVKLQKYLCGTVHEDTQNLKALLVFCQHCHPPPILHLSDVIDPLNHYLHSFYTSKVKKETNNLELPQYQDNLRPRCSVSRGSRSFFPDFNTAKFLPSKL